MLIAEIMYVCKIYNVLLKSMLTVNLNYMSLNFNYNYVPCLQTQLKFRHSQIIPAFGNFYICQSTNLWKADQAELQFIMKGSK